MKANEREIVAQLLSDMTRLGVEVTRYKEELIKSDSKLGEVLTAWTETVDDEKRLENELNEAVDLAMMNAYGNDWVIMKGHKKTYSSVYAELKQKQEDKYYGETNELQ